MKLQDLLLMILVWSRRLFQNTVYLEVRRNGDLLIYCGNLLTEWKGNSCQQSEEETVPFPGPRDSQQENRMLSTSRNCKRQTIKGLAENQLP